MGISEPLRSFWYAVAELNPTCRRTSWGLVKTDSRYPIIWDANHAEILEEAPDLTLGEVRAALVPALREAGARHEHVEFWGTSTTSPALIEARRSGRRQDPDAVMVFQGSADDAEPPSDGVHVSEIVEPDEPFWSWYGETRREFGVNFTEEVVNQMLRLDREVFHPAGLRWFVGIVGGLMAGFSSLLSLEGVGYLDSVVTLPQYRRLGVATATVLRAVGASLAAGDRLVHLLAQEGGAPQRLYERLGFRVEARVESFTSELEGDRT